MKKILFVFCVALSQLMFAQPANDDCTGAISLGTLGAPGACGTGIKKGTTQTIAATNVNATPENPYTYQSGCSNLPANNIWYSFTAPANGFGVTISVSGAGGTLTNPQISLWAGTCAGGFSPMGCISGAAGTATLSVGGTLVPGTTYYFSISGADVTQSGTFTLKVNAYQDCNECLNAGHITANPLPVNGTYQPGQTVSFCFHVDQWTQANLNYLHGVQMSFGPGWDITTLTTAAPATYYSNAANNTNCSGSCGIWTYFPGGCTSSASGVYYGPGFYHTGSYLYAFPSGICSCYTNNANPGAVPSSAGGGDGSADAGNGGVLIPPAGAWNFCWTIKVGTGCNPGNPLTVTVTTTGDGQSGSYTASGCSANQPVLFNAVQACCPPSAGATASVSCFGGTDGVATATAVVGASGNQNPYIFTWTNSGGTIATHTVNSGTTDNASSLAAGIYTVTVVDQNLCSATSTITVTQPTAVSATATPTNANCTTGGSINGSASGGNGGYTYSWAGPSGYSSNSQNISGLNAGVYTLTVTDSKSCTKTVTATVNQTGSATAAFNSSSTAQCLPTNSFTFTNTGTGGATYTWDFGDASATGSGSPATHTYASAGTYVITETVTLGSCTNTITHTVTVNALPNAGVPTSGGQLTCSTLTTTVNDPVGGMNYSWAGPGIVSGGSTATATVNAAGVYTVTVTDPATNCSSSATTTVTTNNSVPTATASAGAALTCATNTTTVTGGSSTGGVTYSWAGPGIVSGGTTTTPTVNATGVYTLTVTDPSTNCTAVSNATVTINNTPPNASSSAGPALTCTTNTTTVNGSSSTGGATLNWSGPGIVSGATTGTPTVNATGVYTLTVTDPSNGCTATSTATVTLNNTPPNASATAGAPLTCATNTTTVNGSSSTGGAAFSWAGPGIVSGATSATATVNAGGDYTLTVTDPSNGCTSTATASITTNGAFPNASATAGPSLNCSVLSTTVNASSTTAGVTYSWNGPGIVTGGSSATATVNAVGVYTVTVTDPANGCQSTATATITNNSNLPNATASATSQITCATNTTTVNGNSTTPGATFNWAGPGIVSGGSTATPTVNAAGVYTVTVTDPSNGCTSTANATVTLNNTQPNASGTGGQITCSSATVSITGSSTTSGATFSWSGPGVVSGGNTATSVVNAGGNYTVTVTDPANGCTNTAPVTVTTNTTAPNAGIASTGLLPCGNGTTTITGSSTTAGATFSWAGSGIVSGGNTPIPTVNAAGVYVLTVTDPGNGCTSPANATVTIAPSPTITGTWSPDSANCGMITGGVHGVSVSGGAAPISYNWTNAAGLSVGTASVLTGVGPGAYTLTVTDANQCTATMTGVPVPGNPVVNAAFTPSPSQGTVPLTVGLTNNSTGATQYLWSFGNGTGSAAVNPAVIYGTSGVYTITLVASNGSCWGMDTALIIVDDATSIVIPNIFSPNGDAINDEFIITCTGIKSLHCDILNRWGQLVYTLESYNQNWDGKLNNGNNASEGTYFFMLDALGADGKTYKRQGTITLVK